MEAELRSFLAENFLLGEELRTLPASASLIEAGIIDSTGVLELVSFLESTFGIEVADEEMLPENLDSVRAVSAYVTRKLEQKRSARLAAA